MFDKFIISSNKPLSLIQGFSMNVGENNDNLAIYSDENSIRNINLSNGKNKYENRNIKLKILNIDGTNRHVVDEIVENLKGKMYLIVNNWYCLVEIVGISFNEYLLSEKYVEMVIDFNSDWTWKHDTVIEYDPEKWSVISGEHWRDYTTVGRGYNYGYTTDTNFILDIKPRFAEKSECSMEVIFYGSCQNPYITYEDKRIGVNIDVGYDEYVVLNQNDKSVIKYTTDSTVNVFANRMKFDSHSIFNKIKLPNTLSAKPGLKFKIIVTEERRSPLWS